MPDLEFYVIRRAGGELLSRLFLRSEARRINELLLVTSTKVRCRIGDTAAGVPEYGYSEIVPSAIGDFAICEGIDEGERRLYIARTPDHDRLFTTPAMVRQYAHMLDPEVYTVWFDLSAGAVNDCRIDIHGAMPVLQAAG